MSIVRDNRTGRGILIISISNIIRISNAASISGNQNKFWPGYILIVKIGIFILKNTLNIVVVISCLAYSCR